MAASPPPIYEISTHPVALCSIRQGEILTNVQFIRSDPATLGLAEPNQWLVTHPHAIVVSQDCDLEQDYRVRFPNSQASDKLIPSILLCEVFTAEELFGGVRDKLGKKAWDRIQRNNDVRYHYLQSVPAVSDRQWQGLPELAIDFKRFFTVPTDELYRRIQLRQALCRCRLASPYLEHLCSRFASYLRRVALPLDHVSE